MCCVSGSNRFFSPLDDQSFHVASTFGNLYSSGKLALISSTLHREHGVPRLFIPKLIHWLAPSTIHLRVFDPSSDSICIYKCLFFLIIPEMNH